MRCVASFHNNGYRSFRISHISMNDLIMSQAMSPRGCNLYDCGIAQSNILYDCHGNESTRRQLHVFIKFQWTTHCLCKNALPWLTRTWSCRGQAGPSNWFILGRSSSTDVHWMALLIDQLAVSTINELIVHQFNLQLLEILTFWFIQLHSLILHQFAEQGYQLTE